MIVKRYMGKRILGSCIEGPYPQISNLKLTFLTHIFAKNTIIALSTSTRINNHVGIDLHHDSVVDVSIEDRHRAHLGWNAAWRRDYGGVQRVD